MGDCVIHSSHHIEATVNYRSGKKEKSADLFRNRLGCCFPMKTGKCVQTTKAANQEIKNELVPQHVNSRLSKRSAIVRAHCNRFLSENN